MSLSLTTLFRKIAGELQERLRVTDPAEASPVEELPRSSCDEIINSNSCETYYSATSDTELLASAQRQMQHAGTAGSVTTLV